MGHRLIFLVVISLAGAAVAAPAPVKEGNKEHAGNAQMAPARAPNPNQSLCVCEFDPMPNNCGAKLNEKACRGFNRDCMWGTKPNAPGPTCNNIHEFYCLTEFSGTAPRQAGCTQIQIIPQGANPPGCPANMGKYRYTFHGHGPRSAPFQNSVETILKASAASPQCEFVFQDQTCETWRGSIDTARTAVTGAKGQPGIQALLKGAQKVTMSANQMVAMADYNAPWRMRNPHWAFQFNARAITNETAVSCTEDILCQHHQEEYLCFDGPQQKFRQRACCCTGGFGKAGGGMPGIPGMPGGGPIPQMPGQQPHMPPQPGQQPQMPGQQLPNQPSSYPSYYPYDEDGDIYEDNPRPRGAGVCRWLNNQNLVAAPQAASALPKLNCPAVLPAPPHDAKNWNKP